MRIITAFLLVLLAGAVYADIEPAAKASSSSQVTLAIGDYESMRDATLRPSATVVDTIPEPA
jgi:hypothetical protein